MIDPTALFLGPQGQNADLLERLLLDAVRDHVHWRRGFHPEDPDAVDPFRQLSPDFCRTVATSQAALRRLLARLKGSVPFHSPRYIGHMTGDTLLPAQIGYLAAMLYNPNNVAFEGSPITSQLEREVAADLAALSGFDPARSWGHLCGGGTIANIEALWMFRNLAFAPLTLPEHPGEADVAGLTDAAGQPITAGTPRDTLVGRLPPEVALSLLNRAGAPRRPSSGVSPAVLVSASCHYSWQKAVDLLGLGAEALVKIPLDAACRLDPRALHEQLQALGREGRPILACVGVIGTTEGGGVDPLDTVIELRDEHAAAFGQWFFVHADAAYGGYARSLLRDDAGILRPFAEVEGMEHRVYDALKAVDRADAITIDPHKLGFIPYPAGALVVRDGRLREAMACRAAYVNDGHRDHVGSFTVEGSKPGAAAAACWLAHRAVPLTNSGYGAILRESFRSARGLAGWLAERTFSEGRFRCAVLAPPDLDVVLYAFGPSGGATLASINDCTERVLAALPSTGEGAFALSSTWLAYGGCDEAARALLGRLGAPADAWHPGAALRLVRSAMMTPFVAEPHLKQFYRQQFAEALERALAQEGRLRGG